MEDEKYSVVRIRTEDLDIVRRIALKRDISVPRAIQIAIGLLEMSQEPEVQTEPVKLELAGTIK